MPTTNKLLKAKQNKRYAQHLKREYDSMIVALGNQCSFYRNGDCRGDLQLDHKFGHRNDPRPWTIPKLKKEFAKNNLRVLCMYHNVIDGVERKKILRKQKSLEGGRYL